MRKLLIALLFAWPCSLWAMEGFLKQSTATTITVTMVSTTDGYSGKTGLTLTIRSIKNGSGSGAAITPTVTEVSSANAPGVYALALTTGHTDTLGELHLYVTGTAAIPTDCKWEVSTYLPGEAATLQADQAVNATKLAGTSLTGRDIGASVLLSSGTGTGQLDFTSGIVKANVTQLLGTAWLAPGTAGTPDVNVKLWNGLATVALPLVPTVAGRTLDVSAGGEAGLDWANVGSPTTSLALTGTTIADTQKVDVNTIKTNPVVNAGTITFPSGATLASTTNITAATGIDVTKWLGGTIPAVNVTGVPLVDLKYTLGTISPAAAGSVRADSVTGAVGSVTGNVGGNVTGSVGSVAGAVGSVTARVTANTDQWAGGTIPSPTVTGVPNVNAKTWNDLVTVALPLVPTTAGRTLDVSTGGEAGIDWANVGSPTSTVGLSGTTIGTLTTYTGNTPQTGDSFARIGSAGAGLTAIFANNTVDSGLTAGNAMKYIMAAVFNTVSVSGTNPKILQLKLFDQSTNLSTQSVPTGGGSRTTTP